MRERMEKVIKIYANNRCKELRVRKKLTQVDISNKLGTSDWIITKFETTGKINPKYLKGIADILDVDIDFLIGKSKVSIVNPTEKAIANLNNKINDIDRELYYLKLQNQAIQNDIAKFLLNKEENKKTSFLYKIFKKRGK